MSFEYFAMLLNEPYLLPDEINRIQKENTRNEITVIAWCNERYFVIVWRQRTP